MDFTTFFPGFFYGTPPSAEETAAFFADQAREKRLHAIRGPEMLALFGSRIAQGGRYALPDSDLDVLYAGLDPGVAERRVREYLRCHPGIAPEGVELNLIRGRGHYCLPGYEYEALPLMGPTPLLARATGAGTAIRVWGLNGARKGGLRAYLRMYPPAATADREGDATWQAESLLNALSWCKARGIDPREG